MHSFSATFSTFALFASAVSGSYLNSELSFGHTDRISPHPHAVPNFHLVGNPNHPEILSNKLVLTFPTQGNQRGAVWSENTLQHSSWGLDVDFRATGPERGGGNFQIWYAKNGLQDVGTSSIYTVGKFDGLALVVDQYAGSGGFIRGFLNDGFNDYKTHHSVDSLAFGHCEYSYRNLGRPSRIHIKHTSDTFKVEVDGRLCFETPHIKLPLGYNFGISAASSENPDSFEIFKMVSTTESHTPDNAEGHEVQESHLGEIKHPEHDSTNVAGRAESGSTTYDDPPESPASSYHSSAEQFADLHNRLQAMMRHISGLNKDLNIYQSNQASWHNDMVQRVTHVEETIAHGEILSYLVQMNTKLDTINNYVTQTKQELHEALDRHVAGLRNDIDGTHGSIQYRLDSHLHWGRWLGIMVAGQLVSICGYVLYKRRKARSPKKYL